MCMLHVYKFAHFKQTEMRQNFKEEIAEQGWQVVYPPALVM